MEQVLAIFASEEKMANKLAVSLERRFGREYRIALFTKEAAWDAYEAKEAVALLLCKETQALRADGVACLYLTEEKKETDDTCYLYQPLSGWEETIRKRLSANGADRTGISPKDNAVATGDSGAFMDDKETGLTQGTLASQWIGVYSPAGGMGISTTAFLLAVAMASNGATLFVSLDPFSGLPEELSGDGMLSELFYLLKEYGAQWYREKRHCIRNVFGIEAISGLAHAKDQAEWSAADAAAFAEGIRQDGSYRTVVLDLGTWNAGNEALMQRCQSIWLLRRDGQENERKEAAFLRQWAADGRDLAKLHPMTVPHDAALAGGVSWESAKKGVLLPWIRENIGNVTKNRC